MPNNTVQTRRIKRFDGMVNLQSQHDVFGIMSVSRRLDRVFNLHQVINFCKNFIETKHVNNQINVCTLQIGTFLNTSTTRIIVFIEMKTCTPYWKSPIGFHKKKIRVQYKFHFIFFFSRTFTSPKPVWLSLEYA